MRIYLEEQVLNALRLAHSHIKPLQYVVDTLKPIELPSDEEIIGKFMNWFLKHYSTATIDGFFGYVNSLEEEVSIKEILDDYFNQNK